MVQKYLAMVAILGAIAALGSIGMVTTGQVKAFERTCHYWSNGDSQCEWGPYFAYTQHPTVQQVVDANGHIVNMSCCAWWHSGFGCEVPCDGYTSNGGASISDVAFTTTPTNCFWSYPVQCN
jgi:hypothetical protein